MIGMYMQHTCLFACMIGGFIYLSFLIICECFGVIFIEFTSWSVCFVQKLSSAAAPSADFMTTCLIPPPPPPPPPPPLSSGSSAKKVVNSVQQPPAAAATYSKDLSVRRAVMFNSCPKPFVKPWAAPNTDCGEKQRLRQEEDTEDAVEPVCDQVSDRLAAS